MEYNIQQVDEIHEVVQAKPNEQSIHCDFRKTETENDDPKVIQKSEGHHHGPVITQPASRVEYKGQIASGIIKYKESIRLIRIWLFIKVVVFYFKGIFFYETRQKIFSLLGGKTEFEFRQLRQCWAVGAIQI